MHARHPCRLYGKTGGSETSLTGSQPLLLAPLKMFLTASFGAGSYKNGREKASVEPPNSPRPLTSTV